MLQAHLGTKARRGKAPTRRARRLSPPAPGLRGDRELRSENRRLSVRARSRVGGRVRTMREYESRDSRKPSMYVATTTDAYERRDVAESRDISPKRVPAPSTVNSAETAAIATTCKKSPPRPHAFAPPACAATAAPPPPSPPLGGGASPVILVWSGSIPGHLTGTVDVSRDRN